MYAIRSYYDQTVTSGIVSALGISLNISGSYSYQIAEDLIQTDVAINSGNSGTSNYS